jgi:hypothetical protein
MRAFHVGITSLLMAAILILPGNANAKRLKRGFTGFVTAEKAAEAKSSAKKDDRKPYEDLIEDRVVVEGLFTFYVDTTDKCVLMAIKPDQFDKVYLCGETVSRSAAFFSDAGRMWRTYPFFFRQIGENLQFMEKNIRLRADSASTLRRAVEDGISDHLLGATPIMSKPHDETGAVLIDASELLVVDAVNWSYFAGSQAKTGHKFDKKNSYVDLVKGFPQNVEIDVTLHYATSKPSRRTALQNPYSLYHTHHYSFSELPDSDYQPRLADERLGHFMTVYQDYSSPASETPYVRYVRRWDLKKKYPDSAMSEPVNPIVFWVENTVPEEYREWVAEGIEFWNHSFEKIGFRNAIVAKQMPDTAVWDPADVRYSTVRWIVPGSGPAVGPSRANPYTGELFDADIRIPADFIRHMHNNAERWVSPLSFDGMEIQQDDHTEVVKPYHGNDPYGQYACTYAEESQEIAGWGYALISSLPDDFAGKDSLSKQYIHQYLVQLVAHEVGHTIGLRHNFKASAIYSLGRINDPEFTGQHGNVGTIMEYPSVWVAGPDGQQGDFYSVVPGPHDDWVVEYAYSDFAELSFEEELPRLQVIAGKAGDPRLLYGTDEDGFGYSIKSPDPYCNLFDIGDDPLAFCEHQIGLTKELWFNALKEFEKPGARYQKLYNSFLRGWIAYSQSARIASKFIGGLERNRSRIGDANARLPFMPVPAAEQRRAMELLKTRIFAEDAFDFPSQLLNKLEHETFPGFNIPAFSMTQVDYPIHQRVLYIQQIALSRLYSPYVVGRLLNNIERVSEGDETYTMYDMFTDVRRAIWKEIVQPRNVNSYRRQLQLAHLNWIMNIYLSGAPLYPTDARTLAANDLEVLEGAARRAADAAGLNDMSRAHYREVLRQIRSTREARRSYLMK